MNRRSLAGTLFVGALSLASIGCKSYVEYRYDGKIGEDQVKFKEIYIFPTLKN